MTRLIGWLFGWKETVEMKLVDFAKRRPDGLIDQIWVEGFEAYKLQESPDSCPYDDTSDQFITWVEGWMDAASTLSFPSQEVC
jgi:ribosome modulation factor